jgi:hypothetical protein
MSDNLMNLRVRELVDKHAGDFVEHLSRGWRLGVVRGIASNYDLCDARLAEDAFFLDWRGWRHSEAVYTIAERTVGSLIDEWREVICGQVRAHIRATNERLARELDEIGQLEVELLSA